MLRAEKSTLLASVGRLEARVGDVRAVAGCVLCLPVAIAPQSSFVPWRGLGRGNEHTHERCSRAGGRLVAECPAAEVAGPLQLESDNFKERQQLQEAHREYVKELEERHEVGHAAGSVHPMLWTFMKMRHGLCACVWGLDWITRACVYVCVGGGWGSYLRKGEG